MSTAAEATSRTANAGRHGALGNSLLQGGAGHHSHRRRSADEEALRHVDVAVGAVADRAQPGDHDDRRERRARGLALAVAEPEDQERHHDRAAPHSEQRAERPGGGRDRAQPEEPG